MDERPAGLIRDELAAEVAFGDVRVELHPTDNGAGASINGGIEGPEAVFGEGAFLAEFRAIGKGAGQLDEAGGRNGHRSVAVTGGAGGIGRDGDGIRAALRGGIRARVEDKAVRVQLGDVSREAVCNDALKAVCAGEVQAEAHGEQTAGNKVEGVGCEAGKGAELAGQRVSAAGNQEAGAIGAFGSGLGGEVAGSGDGDVCVVNEAVVGALCLGNGVRWGVARQGQQGGKRVEDGIGLGGDGRTGAIGVGGGQRRQGICRSGEDPGKGVGGRGCKDGGDGSGGDVGAGSDELGMLTASSSRRVVGGSLAAGCSSLRTLSSSVTSSHSSSVCGCVSSVWSE